MTKKILKDKRKKRRRGDVIAKTKRNKDREMRKKESLYSFLKSYGTGELVQPADFSLIDNQIKSVATVLSQSISASKEGTIVDIGCGEGILLSRLAELDSFRNLKSWNYCGIDTAKRKSSVLTIAADNNLHRRSDFLDLESFYNGWPNGDFFPRPHIAFIRNVLHELSFSDTAQLLSHLSLNLRAEEMALIQDLAVFTAAEKGHVCWRPEDLTRLLISCGFFVSSTPEVSKWGNRWFNLVGIRNPEIPTNQSKVREEVIKSRRSQYASWKEIGALYPDDERFRDVQIAKIDFDLQFASLILQFENEGITVKRLSSKEQSLVHQSVFTKHLSSFSWKPLKVMEGTDPTSHHFRDRARSLDALVDFLTSEFSVTIVTGPPLMGKTELVRHFLVSGIFVHNRVPIFIDIQATSSSWNILEIILSEIGCSVPSDILKSMTKLEFSDITEKLKDFFGKQAYQLVMVFDHVERITDPDGRIHDGEITGLLTLLSVASDLKIIMTSRRQDTDLSFFPNEKIFPRVQPTVGRFPIEREHVTNVLQSYYLQPQYPAELVEAIDNHPFLANLAGMYLRRKGTVGLTEDGLVEDLKQNLRDAIFSKIITPVAEQAAEMAGKLRIPVPRRMLVALSSEDSVLECEAIGILRPHVGGYREDLIGCIGALQERSHDIAVKPDIPELEEEVLEASGSTEMETHERIAGLFEELYDETDDPIWLREAYYHRIIHASPDKVKDFGKRYRSELFAAGEYWYRKYKDFSKSLWAYQRAFEFGQSGYFIEMRISSCKVRAAQQAVERKEGENGFEELIARYPNERGIKTAYVDAILFNRQYEKALGLLKRMGLTKNDSWWIAGQYGRIYSGLHEHRLAIESFEVQLNEKADALAYENIARAYHRLGDTQRESDKIREGLKRYPSSISLRRYMGAIYERIGKAKEAIEYLEPLLEQFPDDGWVFFPYLRALSQLNQLDKAADHWKRFRYRIRPEFLRIPIECDLLVKQGHYDRAIREMKLLPDDEHKIGQMLEAYSSWASSKGDSDEAIRIAEEALQIKVPPAILKNVPVLVTRTKLSIVAMREDIYEESMLKISELNPYVSEIARLQAEHEKNIQD
jgi:tetratricopeptide (TPR) repeat protein